MSALLIRSIFKKLPQWTSLVPKRLESQDLQYDLSEDIILTTYKKVMIIGINLPEASNALNDSALCKLNQRLKDFNSNDQFTVAILHGIGGNFCTGIQSGASIEKSKEIIKTMQNLKKPTIAALTGFTTFFGFHLAIMCDFRVMEMGSVCGFGHGKKKGDIDADICKRLLALTSLPAALDFVLCGGAVDNSCALSYGLVNRCVECGTGLSRCITMAASIAKFPVEDIIHKRNLIVTSVM